jgi:hypothetical protein
VPSVHRVPGSRGRPGAGEVRIGEAGNLTALNKEAWNTLVDLIQSGRLAKL